MIEVVRALQHAHPEVAVTVKTSAPRRLYDVLAAEPGSSGTSSFDFVDFECDTGMVQIDSLHLDETESLRRAKAFHASLAERATAESTSLNELGARLVVGDIPPLAFAAAARAGLPAIAIGNFTWDWIYAGYGDASARPLIDTIQGAYSKAARALRLPMAAGFEGLEEIVRDIPFIARHSSRDPAEVRRSLGVPGDKPLVLMSFGGYGLAAFNSEAVGRMRHYTVMTTDFPARSHGLKPAPGLIYVSEAQLGRDRYRYEDLVLAADVVVTKPGYGIISDCIANETAILYTSRGRFPEYEVLVHEMPKYLRAQFIEQDDLLAGRWEPALEQLLSSPKPAAKPATNGAEVAVEWITKAVFQKRK